MKTWLLFVAICLIPALGGCSNPLSPNNPAGTNTSIDEEYRQHIANSLSLQSSIASDLANWYQQKSDTQQEFPEPATTHFQNALQDDGDVLMDLIRRQKFIEDNNRVPQQFFRSNDVLRGSLMELSNAIAQMMDGAKNRNIQTINSGEEIFKSAIAKLDKIPK